MLSLCYNTRNLQENTNIGAQQEREVKHRSFPAKMGNLLGMFTGKANEQ